MDKQEQITIAFIGAGGVNFGGVDPGSPWDHASRLEVLNDRIPLKVVGISDPDEKRLDFVLVERLEKEEEAIKKGERSADKAIWKETKKFKDFIQMLDDTKPQAVFIGIPPAVHGDIEKACCARGIHMFIEKPISCKEPAFVEAIRDLIEAKPGLIVSVGYMLRYHKAVEFIKATLAEQNVQPVAISARYNSAYVSIPKPMWWDTRRSGGPVVEQGTHFCDLARYFGGEVLEETLSSIAVSHNSPVGKLSEIPPGCETDVPPEFRINRSTNAQWRFSSGAVGVLQHALLMKGTRYFTELEIWCDGLLIKLIDPYSDECTVSVTKGSETKTHQFPDDPYLTEDEVFLNAIKTGDCTSIKSSYADSVKTYKLSWVIQNNAK